VKTSIRERLLRKEKIVEISLGEIKSGMVYFAQQAAAWFGPFPALNPNLLGKLQASA